MSHVVLLFALLSALPLLTTSLQCYTCDSSITVNYTVTSDTVPKFTGCPPTSIDTCQRCETAIGKQASPAKELCATCPRFAGNHNLVIREAPQFIHRFVSS